MFKLINKGHVAKRPWKVGNTTNFLFQKALNHQNYSQTPNPPTVATRNQLQIGSLKSKSGHHQPLIPINYKRPNPRSPPRMKPSTPQNNPSNRFIYAHRHRRIDQEQTSRKQDRQTADGKKKKEKGGIFTGV